MPMTKDLDYEQSAFSFGRIVAKGKLGTRFFKGGLAQFDNTGKLVIPSDSANLQPVFGVVTKGVDCTTVERDVEIDQCAYWTTNNGGTQAQVGRYIYALSDWDFSWTSTKSGPCGIVEAVRGDYRLINLYRACSRTGAV